jgi:hypothetical protein
MPLIKAEEGLASSLLSLKFVKELFVGLCQGTTSVVP